MSYDEIISEIKTGLTGDSEADIKYLKQKISEYENHEEAERIAGVCGQMIYERLPESLKEEFSSLNEAMRLGIEEYTDAAVRLMDEGNNEAAEEKLKQAVRLLEESDLYDAKDEVPYYDFRKPMEEALFREEFGFEKRIKLVPEPVVGLYRLYSALLYDKGEHEKALEYLDKAGKWNPYHQKTHLEYADNLRALGRFEEFKELICDVFTFAYEAETLAGCYRRLTWYFSEKGLWEPASVCAMLAGKYGKDTETLKQEKEYILKSAGSDFKLPEEEDFLRIAKDYDFPCEPDMYIIALAATAAKEFEEAGNAAAGKYFKDIVSDLSGEN